jgi:hypothetical protein
MSMRLRPANIWLAMWAETSYDPDEDSGPDFEENLDAEMSFRPAPPRRRHRHSREEVLARATTRRYKARDKSQQEAGRRRCRCWWCEGRKRSLLMQKGKRP